MGMAHYRHLPIWKAALDLAVLLEHAVRRIFPLQQIHPGRGFTPDRAASVRPIASHKIIHTRFCSFGPERILNFFNHSTYFFINGGGK